MVLPNMDDLAFFNTDGEVFRGGIWDPSVRSEKQFDLSIPAVDSEPSLPIGTPVIDPTVLESPVPVPESPADNLHRTSASLRHRKTTPNLRTSSEIPLDEPPPLPMRYKADLHDHTEREINFSFDMAEHIGELNGNPETKGKDTKATIVGTVKKWGTWYFKDRKNGEMNEGVDDNSKPKPRRNVSNDSLRRKSTPALTSKLDRAPSIKSRLKEKIEKPISAPLPHSFPPELMDAISSGQAATSGEAVAENSSAESHSSATRSKSIKEHPVRRKNTWEDSAQETLGNNSTVNMESTETEEPHHDNPSLRLLRKPTSSAAVTIPESVPTTPSKSIQISPNKKSSAISSLSSSLSSQGSHTASLEKDKTNTPESTEKVESLETVSTPLALLQPPQEVFDMDPHTEPPATVKVTGRHHVKRKPVGSGPHSHHESLEKGVATATLDDDASKYGSHLGQIPSELPYEPASSNDSASNAFAAPILAPPPRMLERTLGKRPSNENMRSNPYTNEQLQHHLGSKDGGITVPMPVSAAMSYTHEKKLNDFLMDTTPKFETSSPPQQIQESASPKSPPSKKRSKSIVANVASAPSVMTAEAEPAASTSLNSPEPILGYRKGKPKHQNQGFKFFS